MDSIEESKTTQDIRKGLPKLGVTILIVIVLYQVYRHYELINARYNNEKIKELNVISSDKPKYTPWSKHVTGRYSIKAKEFNCHFWIINEELNLIENNDIKRHKIESIERGDSLKLNFYESDEKYFNGLYSEVELIGLSINNEIVYTVDDIKIYNKENQRRGLITASAFCLMIIVGLIWNKIKKSED